MTDKSHTLHEVKKCLLILVFTLQESTLLQCIRMPTIFDDLGQK